MKTIIDVDNVSYRYHESVPALGGVSLSVQPGELFALIGSNGCGKSTLLQIMSGLLFPDSGALRVDGEDVTEKRLRDRAFLRRFRSRVGYVFQNSEAQLFCPTVTDELLFAPLQLGLTADEALERAATVSSLLNIEGLGDRPTHMLSGGEKKRVAIAAVLTMNPTVLLLDEPTSGLDPRTESFLTELIFSLHDAGKTIVIASHNLELIGHLEPRIAVINEEHRLERVGAAKEILGDLELLLRVNLVHEHLHRHGRKKHRHAPAHYFFHTHHDRR